MSEDNVPKLNDSDFLILCLLVRDHGELFPEELQPQIAARFSELLTQGRVRDASVSVVGLEATVQVGTVTRPRGRPPGELRKSVLCVRDIMAGDHVSLSQGEVCRTIAIRDGHDPETLERAYQRLKEGSE